MSTNENGLKTYRINPTRNQKYCRACKKFETKIVWICMALIPFLIMVQDI